jgi:ribonuclease Z
LLALTILGNNSAIPAYGRNPTSQVLQSTNEAYMIDCGEGTQLQLNRFKIKRNKINHIFISHMHGDHYFGLIGLIASMGLMNRTTPLFVYAPRILQEIINMQLVAAGTILPYPLHFIPLDDNGIILDGKIEVSSFKVKHRIECWGFIFREKKNPRHIDPVRVKSYEIPSSFYPSLQRGKDYINKKGTIIPNEEVTLPGDIPKSYAYCADTIYDESMAEIVKGVDLLYHETTYLKALHERAAMRFHSTTIQAASIAKLAGVKKLLIGHFSSKYEILDEFLNETVDVFPNTELALEGCCYKI